jgi:hypothetical protein
MNFFNAAVKGRKEKHMSATVELRAMRQRNQIVLTCYCFDKETSTEFYTEETAEIVSGNY